MRCTWQGGIEHASLQALRAVHSRGLPALSCNNFSQVDPQRAGVAQQEREEALAAEARAMAPRLRARPPLAAPLAGAAGWALGAAAAALPGRYGAAITSAPPARAAGAWEALVCAVFTGHLTCQCLERQNAWASPMALFIELVCTTVDTSPVAARAGSKLAINERSQVTRVCSAPPWRHPGLMRYAAGRTPAWRDSGVRRRRRGRGGAGGPVQRAAARAARARGGRRRRRRRGRRRRRACGGAARAGAPAARRATRAGRLGQGARRLQAGAAQPPAGRGCSAPGSDCACLAARRRGRGRQCEEARRCFTSASSRKARLPLLCPGRRLERALQVPPLSKLCASPVPTRRCVDACGDRVAARAPSAGCSAGRTISHRPPRLPVRRCPTSWRTWVSTAWRRCSS